MDHLMRVGSIIFWAIISGLGLALIVSLLFSRNRLYKEIEEAIEDDNIVLVEGERLTIFGDRMEVGKWYRTYYLQEIWFFKKGNDGKLYVVSK